MYTMEIEEADNIEKSFITFAHNVIVNVTRLALLTAINSHRTIRY